MSDKSKIQWTDASWNPVRGCSKVSPGCEHCYAMQYAARFSGPGLPYEGLAKRDPLNWTGQLRLVEHNLKQPFRWKEPRRIFVNSMSDLFHERMPNEWIDRIFAVMEGADHHTYQILTKRPDIMVDYLESRYGDDYCPRTHTLFGTSIEDQKRAVERLDVLSVLAPTVRSFLSVEPLLESVDLGALPMSVCWVIIGGESGPKARPCNVAWIRSIVQQCKESEVPCFVKQLGSRPVSTQFDDCRHLPGSIAIKDSKGGDPLEWPEDLRVREFPQRAATVL